MLLINDLRKLGESEFECSGVLDDHSIEFTISVEQPEPLLRSIRLSRLSETEMFRLTSAEEYRAFSKLLWSVVDGETVEFPLTVESDWNDGSERR